MKILILLCLILPLGVYGLPITNGLLSYYNFNSGIVDLAGGSTTTSLVGGVASSSGSGYGSSGGLTFDGVDDYVIVNNVPLTTTAGASNTVSFWMQWAGYNKSNGDMPIGFSTYDLWLQGGNFGFNSGQSDITGISNAGLGGTWVYVTAVFNNSAPSSATHKLYINGVLQTISQRQGSTPLYYPAPSYFYMGSWSASPTSFLYKGTLDEVAVYNRELNPSEINSLYNSYINPVPELSSIWLVLAALLGYSFYRK